MKINILADVKMQGSCECSRLKTVQICSLPFKPNLGEAKAIIEDAGFEVKRVYSVQEVDHD